MSEVMRSPKIYVRVTVEFTPEGQMLPRAFEWEDGCIYEIDRVIAVRPAHAKKAGGQGDRYTIRIGGQNRYLFFEPAWEGEGSIIGRWFLERKD